MICPFCMSEVVDVVSTRPTKKNLETWRRRQCRACNSKFSTHEKIDLSFLKVVKKSGKTVYFSHPKLFAGIYHATINIKKADRGDMGLLAEKLTNIVENNLLLMKKKKITTAEVFRVCCKVLKRYHHSVYLHYYAYFNLGQSKKP